MRILTHASARSAGISRAQLHGPSYRRLFRGAFVDATVLPTLPVLVAAARTLYPQATVTGVTALRLRGASVGTDSPICLATTARIRREGIVAVNAVGHPAGGLASITDALQDAELGLVDEVVTLDELRRLRVLDGGDEVALAESRSASWRLSVPDSASVPESRTRLVLQTSGLPVPLTQHRIQDERGLFVGRVDLAWPDFKVIVEYEGQQHLTNSDQWESDIHRYEELRRLGWEVIRVTAATLRNPIALVLRVESALRSGGWRGRSPSLDAGWLARVC